MLSFDLPNSQIPPILFPIMKGLSICFIASCALRNVFGAVSNSGLSVCIGLGSYFNNKGISESPGGADFDGAGGSFPLDQLPNDKSLTYRGIDFTLPLWGSSSMDNVLAQGQKIDVTAGRFQSLHLLSAGDGGSIFTNNISVGYSDGTTAAQPLLVPEWKDNRGIINSQVFPFHIQYYHSLISLRNFTYTATGIDGNASHIHYFQVPLNAGKTLTSITLPTGTVGGSRFHVFSLTLFTASSLSSSSSTSVKSGPDLVFQYVRSRNQWYNDSALPVSSLETTALSFMHILDGVTAANSIVQVIEVAVSNLPNDFSTSSWLTGAHTVEVSSPHLKTVYAGTLNRLRAGDQARVKIGVVNAKGTTRGATVLSAAVVKNAHGSVIATSPDFEITAGIPEYDNSFASLSLHESPKWFEDSKFGIFVHWGIYSIPAFAPSGVQYAEWYWWQLHNPNNTNSPTWVHHKEVYGEEFLYDQFIPMFDPTAAGWSPDSLTDLFEEAGAKYFVLVTKHHDGVALFDTGSTTNRSTVALGPKEDFIREIINSAATRHPDLVHATYFSTPEWFNPAYATYGFSSWPGGLAHNAYNWSQLEPYTGYIEVEDYVQNIQKPQMQILMDEYETNNMWCDIGGTTNITELMAGWYNRKYSEGKNVAIDDRCGTWLFDYSTPEYSTYGAIPPTKWESNSGLDPFSYGFNAQTPDANYMNTTTAVHMLADIVAKDGNWLLDIGPMGNGTVVGPEVTTLRGIGAWLDKAGKSIYATDYWFIGPQESSNIRFTTTPLAFYITTTTSPSPSFKVESPIPLLANDKITLLGGTGMPLKFAIENETGAVTIDVPAAEAAKMSDAWAFEIVY
ncbi:glycoside hydrolase family 29 protein [Ramaria rubella]|nr:glycoside hydrolase family 29 protein [Ramaria rubella]